MKLADHVYSLAILSLGILLSGQCLRGQSPKPSKPEASVAKASVHQRIAGTKVKLVMPKDFGVTDTFPGFMNPMVGSSILVSEVSNPYAEVVAGFSDEKRLAASKMKVHVREARKQGGNDGLLVQLDQDAGHILVRKWIWVFGDDKHSVMVMGSCMKDHAETQLPILREAVTSARWDLAAEVDVFEGLPFRLDDTAGLVYSSRVGHMACLTVDGKPDLKLVNKAMLLVGPSVGKVEIGDRKTYALERVEWLPYAYAKISEPAAIEIDGMKGFVMRGEGLNRAKKKVAIYGVVLYEGEGYWMIHGSVNAEQSEAFMPVFDRIARSLKRVRKPAQAKPARAEPAKN